jgi:AbrB family looped-hinge helix DNA binding protein
MTRNGIRTRVDKQGRVVIPPELRQELGLEPGEPATLIVEEGGLRIISLRKAISHAQEVARRHTGDRSGLVDEFIRERRNESQRD